MEKWAKTFSTAMVTGFDYIGKLADRVQETVKAFGGWEAVLNVVKPLLAGLAAGFAVNKIIGGIYGVMDAFKALSVFMAANPITIAIAAITAAVFLLWNHSEAFRNFVKGAWKELQDIWSAFASAFTGDAEGMSEALNKGGILEWFVKLGAGAREVWNVISGFFSNAASQFGNLIGAFKDGDAQGVGEVLDNIFGNTGKLVPAFRTLFEVGQTVVTTFMDIRSAIMDGLGAAFTFVTGTVIPGLMTMGETMSGPIIGAFNKIKEVAVPIFTEVFGGIMSVVSPVIDFLKTAWQDVSDRLSSPAVAEAIGHIGTAFTTFHGIVMNVWGGIAQVIGWAWDNVISPVFGFIVAAVQSVFPALNDLWNIITGVFDTIVNLINGDWGKAWDSFKGILWDAVKLVGHLLGSIGTIAWEALKGLGTILWNLGKKAGEYLWKAIKWGADKIWDLLRGLGGLAWDGLKGLGSILWDAGKAAIGFLWDALKWGADKVWTFFTELPGKVWNFLTALPGTLWDAGLAAMTMLSNALWDGLVAVTEFFIGLPGTIWDLLTDAGDWLLDTGKSILTGLLNGIIEYGPKVWKWLKDLPGVIWEKVKGAASWLVDTGRNILTGMLNGIVNGAVAVWNWLTALPGTLWGYVKDAASWLFNTGKDILQGVYNGVLEGVHKVWNWFLGLPGMVKGWIVGAKDWLVDKGKNIIEGLWNGMNSMKDWVKDKVTGLLKAMIPDPLESLFGIQSPSKLFHYYGEMLMAGLVGGIDDNTQRLMDSVSKVMDITNFVYANLKSQPGRIDFTGAGAFGIGNWVDTHSGKTVGYSYLEDGRIFRTIDEVVRAIHEGTATRDTYVQKIADAAALQNMAQTGVAPVSESEAYTRMMAWADEQRRLIRSQLSKVQDLNDMIQTVYKGQTVLTHLRDGVLQWTDKTGKLLGYSMGEDGRIFSTLNELFIALGERTWTRDSFNDQVEAILQQRAQQAFGAGGNTYNLKVEATPATDKAAIGKEIVSAIDAYEKGNGPRRTQ